MDMADVQADWAHELSGFENAPHAIKYALQNLPASKPQTVIEFRAIAYKAPSQPIDRRLEAPKGDPEAARKAKEKIKQMLAGMKGMA